MITEELGLDVSPAQDSLESLGADLNQIVQQFQVGLVDALSVLTSVEIEPTIDTSGISANVEDALQAGASDPVQLQLDLGPAAIEIRGLTDQEPPPVVIDADVEPAQEKIDNLTGSSSAATKESDSLGHSVEALGAGAALSRGEVGELGSTIGGIAPEAAAAVAGITAVAGSTKEFFGLAIDAASAERRFNEQLGESAELVEHIKVGNLDTDLKSLVNSLGTTEAAIQASDAKLALLGNSSGTAQEEVAKVVAQVNALAARSVAANPSLGSVADVTDRMSIALTRGGRFAAGLGISLNTAEIAARAQEIATARGSDTVEQFDKIAAGAAISVEKLGGSLKEAIAQGTKDPVIQLAALKAELEETLVTLAKPLISPVFDLLRAGEPIVASVASVFSTLDQALVPIATHIVQAIQPLFSGLADGVTALEPGLISLGGAVGEVIDGFGPLLQIAGELISLFGSGLGTVITVVADALGSVAEPLAIITAGLVGLKVAILLLNADPIVLLATTLVLATVALGGLNQQTDAFLALQQRVKAAAEPIDQALFNNASSIDELKTALDGGDDAFGKFIATESLFAKDPNVGAGLRNINEGIGDLRGQLESGADGLKEFVARGVEAGQIVIQQTQNNGRYSKSVKLTGDQIRELTNIQGVLFDQNGKNIKQGSELVQAFNTQQLAIEQASQAKINELALAGQITNAQINESIARLKAAGAADTYTQVLIDLAHTVPAAEAAVGSLSEGLQAQQQAWIDIGTAEQKAANQADSVIAAQNLQADSSIKLGDAQRQLADVPFQVAAAERAQQSASLDLQDAQRALRDLSRDYINDLNAQKSANFQLTDAIRALQDLQNQPLKDANALTGASLDLRTAQLGVTDATQKLADVRANSASTPEEIEKAEIALARANLEVSNSGIRVKEAQQQQSQEGENLAKAQLGVSQAQQAVDAANEQITLHAEKVQRANLLVADSSDRVHTAADGAAASLNLQQTAMENLAKAIADNQAALNALEAGKTVAGALKLGLAEGLLSPEAVHQYQEGGRVMSQTTIDAIYAAAGIASPSKETIKVGQFLGQGLIVGLDSTSAGLVSAGTDASKQVLSGMQLAPIAPTTIGLQDPRLAVPSGGANGPGGLTVQVFVTPPKDMTNAEAKALGNTIGEAVVIKTSAVAAQVHAA